MANIPNSDRYRSRRPDAKNRETSPETPQAASTATSYSWLTAAAVVLYLIFR